MNLLEERDERTRKRKKDKKRHDSEIALSMNKDESVMTLSAKPVKELSKTTRLLDEGAIEGNGWIDCFIKKGTIEKFINGKNEYLDNITDDFEGNVNLGHLDFATFPYIIGSWTKKDLHVVDIDNDRKALDIDLHLDDDSIFVQELARQPYDIGISAEFYYHLDMEATMDFGFEVIDEIFIKAYGLVGECGNVNSDGLELKGKVMDEIKALEVEETTEETVDEIVEEESVVETEETAEESIEEVEEDTEENEDAEEAEGEEGEADETDSEESELKEVFEQVNSLTERIESLEEENAALKKQNKKLSKRLAAKNEEIESFANKFKGISVSLGLTKEEKSEAPVEHKLYAGHDGIGE